MLADRQSRSIKEHVLASVPIKLSKNKEIYCRRTMSQYMQSKFLQENKYSSEKLSTNTLPLFQKLVSLPTSKSSSSNKLMTVSQRTYENITALNTNSYHSIFQPKGFSVISKSNNVTYQTEVYLNSKKCNGSHNISRTKRGDHKSSCRPKVQNSSIHRLDCLTSSATFSCLHTTTHSCKAPIFSLRNPIKNKSVQTSSTKTDSFDLVCFPKPQSVSLPPSLIEGFKTKSKSAIFPQRTSPSNNFQKNRNISSKCQSNLVKNAFNGNHLRHRLSLIHCYGNDYEKIALRHRNQLEREKTIARLESRKADRLKSEKAKEEQRKKIYALNRLMTKLEKKKFKDFMESLPQSNNHV